MKSVLTVLLTVSLFLTACSKAEKKEADEKPPTSAAKEARHEDTAMLHIEPTMLRDLRITTTAVERRSGGESAAILGELRPNENTYAEVGAPVASRIVKVNVSPGVARRTPRTAVHGLHSAVTKLLPKRCASLGSR